MANPLKGEVDFPVDKTTHVLCFTSNALVEIEEVSGTDIIAFVTDWQQRPQSYSPLRLLLWGAMRKHSPDLSLFGAGEMLDDIGPARMEELGGALGKALRFRLSGSFDAPKPVAKVRKPRAK